LRKLENFANKEKGKAVADEGKDSVKEGANAEYEKDNSKYLVNSKVLSKLQTLTAIK
jgi:hypothetical protein